MLNVFLAVRKPSICIFTIYPLSGKFFIENHPVESVVVALKTFVVSDDW
jgi:hypothetical protein